MILGVSIVMLVFLLAIVVLAARYLDIGAAIALLAPLMMAAILGVMFTCLLSSGIEKLTVTLS